MIPYGEAFLRLYPDLCLKEINQFLQNFQKFSYMIPVAYGMMNLNRNRKHSLSAFVKIFSQSKNRKKISPVIKDVDIKGSKGKPWDHRDVKGIGRSAGFRSIAGARRVFFIICFI